MANMWVTHRKASYPAQVHTVATVTTALLHFYPSPRRDGNRLTAGADALLTASQRDARVGVGPLREARAVEAGWVLPTPHVGVPNMTIAACTAVSAAVPDWSSAVR